MQTVLSHCGGLLSRLFIIGLCAATAGCAIGPKDSLRSKDRVTTFGANPQFDNERYEMVDLITLIDPENKRSALQASAVQASSLFVISAAEGLAAEQDGAARRELALAEVAFYNYVDPPNRRNRIQDRLIGASDQRCGAYKVYLNRFDAYLQSGLGSATTLLGGAAGIVGGIKDAKILGGLAGISSGVQSEIAQGFMGNLASYVIIPGIELRRKAILAEIAARRSSNTEYTLQAALADAARYHGACTLVVGLEQAKEAIQTVENPGLRMMAVTLNSVLQTNAMQKTLAKQRDGKLEPEDLELPSFRVEGQALRPVLGSGGVRGLTAPVQVSQDGPEAAAFSSQELATLALTAVQAATATLDKQVTSLKLELTTPTKPALADKVKALVSQLEGRPERLRKARATIADKALLNMDQVNLALSCLKKLDHRLTIADDSQRVAAESDLTVAVAMVNGDYRRWQASQRKSLDSWTESLKVAVDQLGFNAFKDKAASDVDPAKFVKDLDTAIGLSEKAVDGFPTINFKVRGVSGC